MESIDFSGGESSLRPDFVDILDYAKRLGFKNLCTITNGQLLSNKVYLKKLVDHGLNEVLFSVHGSCAAEHDWLTQVPGSFGRLLSAIDNLKELGVLFRANVTVTRKNYKSLTDHAKLFLQKKPLQVNFILFNYWGSADKTADSMAVSYSEAAPYIKQAIDQMKSAVPYINVRYIPMCFMQGYENHITTHAQKIFDPFEWNPIAMSKTQGGIKRHWMRLAYFFTAGFPFRSTWGLGLSMGQRILLAADRFRTYKKSSKCKKCKNYLICDSVEKQYADKLGFGEIQPIPGERITDCLHYRKEFYASLEERFI